MTTQVASRQHTIPATNGPLHCALTGKPVSAEEAYWAPPLVTTGELLSMFVKTLFRAPGNLGAILLAEQTDVPYAPDAKVELARRRSMEQAKLLGVLLLVVALIFVPFVLMAMR